MKVLVIKPFKDKHTRVVYQAGQEIEVTKERLKELTPAALGPFVQAVKEKPKEGPKKKVAPKTNTAKK